MPESFVDRREDECKRWLAPSSVANPMTLPFFPVL